MLHFRAVGIAAALGLAANFGTSPSLAGQPRRTPVVEAVQKVKPSVVSISSEKKAASNSRWPFSPEETQRPRVSGMGTGVIIDARGYIITNQHVVDKVQGVEVRLSDGSTYPARVVQQDEATDLAIIKIEAGHALPAVAMGTSADLMEGEQVITIGNAFGYENTVSTGIVSFVGRNVTLSDDQVYHNLIQTDACINPGNSGGPMVNIDGELIGINVAVRAGAQGIGFALAIDDVKKVAAEMLSTRRLSATWHGLITSESRVPMGQPRPVVVADVPAGSPADQAGIKVGDQVLKVGDLAVTSPLDIERGLLDARAGQTAEVLIRRTGQDKAFPIQLQPLPRVTADAGLQVWRALGLRTSPVSREYVATVSSDYQGGLYVQEVSPGSPASRAAIQKGDILIGLHDGTTPRETIKADNILYVLAQPEIARSHVLPYYIVRNRKMIQGEIVLGDSATTSYRR